MLFQDVNAELLSHRDDIESTKEHLNNLCRKYQTPELNGVQEKVANLSTKYDRVFKLSSKGALKLYIFPCLIIEFTI